jgi:hypothetical protein
MAKKWKCWCSDCFCLRWVVLGHSDSWLTDIKPIRCLGFVELFVNYCSTWHICFIYQSSAFDFWSRDRLVYWWLYGFLCPFKLFWDSALKLAITLLFRVMKCTGLRGQDSVLPTPYVLPFVQVFREGRTKAVGNVLRLIPQASPGAQASRSKPNKMQSKQNSSCVQQTQQILPLALPQTVQQVRRISDTVCSRM